MAVFGSISPCITFGISLVRSCEFLLSVHLFVESVDINGFSFFFEDLLSYLQRETVCVIELECEVAGKYR